MSQLRDAIKAGIDKSLVERNTASAAAMSVLSLATALFLWFTDLDLPIFLLHTLNLLALLVNLIRLWVPKILTQFSFFQDSPRPLIYALVVLNTALWGAIFFISTMSLGADSNFFRVIQLIACGLMISSITSVSLISSLQWVYIVGLGAPLGLGILLSHGDGASISFSQETLIILNLIFMIYSLFQGRQNRKLTLKSMIREYKLQKTYSALTAKQNELLLQQSMTEHSNRLTAMGELAAGIAHEINNPLAIISSSLSLYSTKYGSNMDEKGKELLERANNSVHRIARIIKSLRELTSHNSGNLNEAASLQQIFLSTTDLFQSQLAFSNIKFETNLDDKDFRVVCNPVEISQIILNLINNSIYEQKALPAEDDRWIRLEVKKLGSELEISVANSGPPIDPQYRDKLFMPFFTTKDPGDGTGLGLAISKKLAQKNRGDLNYDWSAEHPVFKLRVPLAST